MKLLRFDVKNMLRLWSAGILFLLTMSASALHASPAGPERWYFTHFTTDDGLAFNSVTSIAQDSNGFIWFATEDGLSRYDGRSFRNFSKEDLGLDTDFITQLCADGNGNLWIGSDNGASRYDFISDSFIPRRTCLDVRERPGALFL